jgi:hypothetical protein
MTTKKNAARSTLLAAAACCAVCDACKYLTPTEKQQDEEQFQRGMRTPHSCKKHGWKLLHHGAHPYIPKPPECNGPYPHHRGER